jgi:hypothetical protein
MRNVIIPCCLGLLIQYFYQKSTGSYKPEYYKKYMLALILMFFLHFIVWFASAYAATENCKWCHYISDYPDIEAAQWKQYEYHLSRAEEYKLIIEQISDNHKWDTEDLFISGACGAIVSVPTKSAKSKAITIALAIIGDYFREKYYCHRATKRYVEEYNYHVFHMNSHEYQLNNNVLLCTECKRLYDAENYWGIGYYKYAEAWKSWYQDLDRHANYEPGCLHTQNR